MVCIDIFCVWKSLLWHFQHFVGGSRLTGSHSDCMTNKKFNSNLHAHKNIFLDFWLDEFISNSGSNLSDPTVGCQIFLNQWSFSQILSIKCSVYRYTKLYKNNMRTNYDENIHFNTHFYSLKNRGQHLTSKISSVSLTLMQNCLLCVLDVNIISALRT